MILSLLGSSFALAQREPVPPFTKPENVEIRPDLVYAQGGGRDLKLDLYLPAQANDPRPAIVFVHGGGWSGGNRKAFARQAAHLAGQGYVGACIEYRLSGEARFPAAIEDCKAAVRWLRAHADEFRIDPNRIAACGGSAGGHLVALLGTTGAEQGLEGRGGNPDFSSRVQLVIPFNGVFDLKPGGTGRSEPVVRFLGATHDEKPELYTLASPISHVSRDDPPFLFLHGLDDTTVPIRQSRLMAQALREAGVPAEVAEYEEAGHGFFNRPPFFEPTLKRLEAFLDRHFRPATTAPEP
jgi:acetyl esterase/lipase